MSCHVWLICTYKRVDEFSCFCLYGLKVNYNHLEIFFPKVYFLEREKEGDIQKEQSYICWFIP